MRAAPVRHVVGPRLPGTAAQDILTPADLAAAWDEITGWPGYTPTPLHDLPTLARRLGVAQILYKDEGPRFGLGSFKALGGAYAALRALHAEITRQKGVPVSAQDLAQGKLKAEAAHITLVSATDGNHGRSLAWGCRRFGARCRIYIHAEVSEGRAQAMRDLGAEVVRIAGDYDASVAMAREEAERHGWLVISDTSWDGYTDPPRDVMAGYGVMMHEACDQMGTPPSHVVVQGGVGGLAAAVAACLRQHYGTRAPRFVVVEPDRAACLFESARAGTMASVEIEAETIMAGLSCGVPSPLAWAILREEASDFVTIPDALVPPAMRALARPLGEDPAIEAGESAVAGLALLMAAADDPALCHSLGLGPVSRVLLIGSEGVTDRSIFNDIMAQTEGSAA
jgi:diaminopropionate ammonia-lyase